jgi:putative chitinase
MTSDSLLALGIDKKWLEPLVATFQKYNINTPKRQAAFIGQCSVESYHFTVLEENLNYSAKTLCQVWGSRFPTLEDAMPYEYKPEKLANFVYGNQYGNTEDGDGWKYRGRGLIQITFKDNYQRCGSSLVVDLVQNPDMLCDPHYAALSAGWFWHKKDLNSLADKQDFETMTKRINGGTLGLEDRKAQIAKTLKLLG